MNIVLTGMPGSGKTTICALLASKLGYTAADTDQNIVRAHGDINSIFQNYGEAYFRSLEREEVQKLSCASGLVIATGGGCLMDARNVANFKKSGKIVFLDASVDELCKRLQGDDTRPLLRGDLRANLLKLYNSRANIYRSAADYTVSTDNLPPQLVAQKITELIKL